LNIGVIEKYERGKFIQHFVLRVQLEKEGKSLFGQTEQAAEEKKQASRNLAYFSCPSFLSTNPSSPSSMVPQVAGASLP